MPGLRCAGAQTSDREKAMRKSGAKWLAGVVLTAAMAGAASAQAPAPAPMPTIAPALPPSRVVNLMTAEGVAALGGQWRHMVVKFVEIPHIPNAMPEYQTTYDVQPHAGEASFDDSSWPTIAPDHLGARRGGGKVSAMWYRTSLT